MPYPVAVEAGRRRHIGETAVAVIAPEAVGLSAVHGEEYVLQAVIVPVAMGNAVNGAAGIGSALGRIGEEPGGHGHVGEAAAAEPAVEAGRIGDERYAVLLIPAADDEVEQPVVVIVEEGGRNGGFGSESGRGPRGEGEPPRTVVKQDFGAQAVVRPFI